NVLDGGDITPLLLAHSHDDIKALLALPDLSGLSAAQRRLDYVLDSRNTESITSRPLTINLDLQLRHLSGTIHKSPRHPSHRRHCVKDLLRFVAQDPRIFTEHLDDNLAIDLRDALQNIVANGLREAGFDAGNSHQSLFHLIDELLFGQSPKPARGRVEIYQELRHVNHLGDRKSTRLNSSHEWISYAVFCLK